MKQDKPKSGKKWIWLVAGLVLVLAIVGVVLAMVLGGDSMQTSNIPMEGRADLYWNIDRLTYLKSSLTGQTSRQPAEDGLYHIRFAYQGEQIDLTTADRTLVNQIDTMDVMGLELGEDGKTIVKAVAAHKVAKEIGAPVYVQRTTENLIIVNAAAALNSVSTELLITENTRIYDVNPEAETIGAVCPIGEIGSADALYVYANGSDEITHIYLYSHPVRSPLYWATERKWGNSTTGSKREPDENGIYTVPAFCEGEIVELKFKDKALVDQIDKKHKYSIHFGATMDQNGYVINLMTADEALGATSPADRWFVTEVNGANIKVQKFGTSPKEYTFTLPEDCPIYDVSLAAQSEGRRGQLIDSLGYGDRITLWVDGNNKPILIYVSNAIVENVPLFYIPERMYSSKNLSTTREPNANGEYHVELYKAGDSGLTNYIVKDKALMDAMDGMTAKMFGLIVDENNVVQRVYNPESLYGNSMLTTGRTVDAIIGPFVTVIIKGNPLDSANAAMSAFCQVYNASGYGEYGRTMLEVGDHITATLGFDGYTDSDIMAAFIISRHIGGDKLHFILDQQYDSAAKQSKRKPDEDGWYRLTVVYDGYQKVVRTRSKAMVDKMESFPVGVALELSGDVVTAAYDPSWAYGGPKLASGYQITSFGEFNTLTAQLQNKVVEVKLADDCIFYNVSDAYYDHKGEVTYSLALGDMITAFANRQGEAKVVYIRGRETKGMYANPNRMYDGKNKVTTRVPDAEGWYVFDLVCDGKAVSVKTKDQALATKIDSNAYTFGLHVVDGVVRSVVPTSWVKNVYGTSYSNWDVTAVNGNKITIKYNLPGSTNTGKTKTIYVSSGTKVYDISPTAEEFGMPCTLKVGDRIRAFNSASDKDNKQEYIYVITHDTRAAGQTAYCEHCKETVFWNPWRGDSFSKGDAHYYLNADITNTTMLSIYNDAMQYEVVLDLNGHTYHTEGHRGFAVYRGETMTIMDSVGGGCLSATGTSGAEGTVFAVLSKGTLNLLSGTIKGVESEKASVYGGGAIYTTANVNIYGGEIIGSVVRTNGDNNKTIAYGGAILCSDAKINMYGGKISGGRAEDYVYGVVDADGNPVIDEDTGLQQTKANDGRGGNVYITGSKSEFNMYGGEIVDGNASHGGNIYVKNGVFNMEGGTISGGVATNGGNVYLFTQGKLITKGDATITGGVATRMASRNNGGGNIFVYLDAAVLMEGGSITNGTAVSYGGNITCRGGELVIKDGVISGGKSEIGGDNVYINGASGANTMFVAAGGQIVDGNVYIHKPAEEGRINAGLTGAPVVEELDLTSGAIFEMYELTEGASVAINGAGTLSAACDKAQEYVNAGYIKHIDANTEIKVAEDNTLYTIDKQTEAYCEHCDKVVVWTPWRGTSLNTVEALESDHYILVQDVKTSSQIRIGADATSTAAAVVVDACIDMNGYSVENTSRAFAVYAGSTLSLVNNSETESFVLGAYKADIGGVINLGGASNLNLYDGVYVESVAETFSSRGGIVHVATGTFNMYGGTIHGRRATSGGAVYVNGGTFNVKGGLITGGSASASGGNIYLNGGVVNITGGIVENGFADGSEASSNGGNIYMAKGELNISGDAVIRGGNATRPVARTNGGGNIYGQDKTVINISGGTIENGTTVSFGGNVYCRGTLTISGGKISGGTAVNGGNIFVQGCSFPDASLNITGGVIENGTATTGELCIKKQMVKAAYNGDNIYIASATANISGGRITDDNGGNALLAFTAVTETPATVNLAVKDNAELIADLDSKIYLVSGAAVSADLGGTKADSDGDKVWCIEGYDEIAPTEPDTKPTEPEQPVLCPHCDQEVQWIDWDGSHLNTTAVVNGGHYVLTKDVDTSSQIRIGADATDTAAAVVVDVCIDLNGHKINNKARAFAVYAGSTLSLVNTSDTESVVTAAYDRDIGGVINLSGASNLNLYDGICLESIAETFPSRGGIVHLATGTFNMYGGTLKGRSAKSGGAVYVNSGTFNMEGGLITGGTATASGGNIFLNNGVINISGGIVENGFADGSEASSNGGNIYMARGELNISGDAIIRGGTGTRPVARSNGGGNIYGQDKTVINISGGTIENGTTVSFGGNVYCRGTLTISGGKISGGTAVNGGNIFVHGCNFPDASLNITGGIIENGTATTGELCNLKLMVKEAYNGDNIYIAAATANISGGRITDDNGGNALLAFIALADNTAEVNLTLAENAELAEMLDGKVYLVSGATLTTDLGAGVADSDGDIVWHKGAAPTEPTQPSEPEETTAPTEATEPSVPGTEPSVPGTEPTEPEATTAPTEPEVTEPSTAPTEPEQPVLCPHCEQEVQWIEWDGSHLNTTDVVSGHYILTKNIDTSSQIRIGADATGTAEAIVLDICIDLDGHSIYNKARAFAVYGGSTLSLVNRNETESVVTAAYDRDIGGVINLSGASGLTGNSNLNLYDGVKLVGGADPFGRRGGVVFVGTGTFHMYGGTLVGQVAASGGAVYVNGGTFNMEGGLITGGSATSCGGNIYLNGGVINISGGIVENGFADGSASSSNGGNIYINKGELNISGDAVIRGGNATRAVARTNGGGNIYGQDKTVINISGGTIENGTTVSFGGNVYCRGTLTISGGKISGGTAENGGNIFVSGYSFADAALNITCGIIENGTATTGALDNVKLMVKEAYNGDNIYVSSAKATISGGEITDDDGGNAILALTAKDDVVANIDLILTENAELAEMLSGKIYLVSGAVVNAEIGSTNTDGDGDQIWVAVAAPVRSLRTVAPAPAVRTLKNKRLAK